MGMSDQLDFHFRAPEKQVWTVRALVSAVRGLVERQYSDCWVDDSRLVVLNARDAAARGATIATRTAQRA